MAVGRHSPEMHATSVSPANSPEECPAPTFKKFAAQAEKRSWTPGDVAKAMDPEEPYAERLAFAKRVFDRRYRNNEIPYGRLIDLYNKWTGRLQAFEPNLCECGCGRPIPGRSDRRFSRDACRKRVARKVRAETPA